MVIFDMDGVLVPYDYGGYVINKETGRMPFEEPGQHYFLNRGVSEVAVAVFRMAIEMFGDAVRVITSVSKESSIRYEQITDKMTWLYRVAPEFDIGANFMAVTSDKRSAITNIRGLPLNKTDIIVDDWKVNLYKWILSGGTAVKYLNGINSLGDWKGYVLRESEGILAVFNELCRIVQEVCAYK